MGLLDITILGASYWSIPLWRSITWMENGGWRGFSFREVILETQSHNATSCAKGSCFYLCVQKINKKPSKERNDVHILVFFFCIAYHQIYFTDKFWFTWCTQLLCGGSCLGVRWIPPQDWWLIYPSLICLPYGSCLIMHIRFDVNTSLDVATCPCQKNPIVYLAAIN